MKKYLINLIIIMLLTVGLAQAQEIMSTDQDKKVKSEQQTKEIKCPVEKLDTSFIDNDGNGINDNSEKANCPKLNGKTPEMKQNRNRGNDHFIDKDGDGINDNRCSGMGICNGKGKGKRGGKK